MEQVTTQRRILYITLLYHKTLFKQLKKSQHLSIFFNFNSLQFLPTASVISNALYEISEKKQYLEKTIEENNIKE